MIKITEIVPNDYVYVNLRHPAFLTQERIYAPNRKVQQSRSYHQVTRAFGKVLSHNTTEHLLVVLPAFRAAVDPHRPEYPMHLPWWCIRNLYRWTGEYNTPQTRGVAEVGSTVFNRLKMAFMRRNTAPLDQPQAAPPSMLFEQVRLNVVT